MNQTKAPIVLTAAVFGVAGIGIALLYLAMEVFSEYESYFTMLCAVLVMVAGGAVMLAALFTAVFSAENRQGCTVPVRAVITAVREGLVNLGDSTQKATVYLPDYTFTLNGEQRTICSYRGSYSRKKYTVGAEVDMLIDPEDKTRYDIPAEARKKVRMLNCIWVPVVAAGAALFVSCIIRG